MEKILISCSPLGKEISRKLFIAVKRKGFSVSEGLLEKVKNDNLPDMVVVVLTKDSEDNNPLRLTIHTCTEKGITVVPFVAFDMENKTLSQDYFLDEHHWIDGFNSSIDEGCESLLDMLQLNYGYLSKRETKKTELLKQQSNIKNKNQSQKVSKSADVDLKKIQLLKNILCVCAAVIVVLLFILVNGGLKQTNREADNYRANSALSNSSSSANAQDVKIQLSSQLKNSEQNFVGRWKMTDYSDNQFRRTRQDSLDLQQLVNTLISRAELVFNADKTFSRIGFSNSVETGVWEYDPQARYLKLQPTGGNQYDVVQIQEIDQSKLIIVVQEKLDSGEVFTKLTFQKQK